MFTVTTPKVSLFVDKTSGQWIVMDSEGGYWVVPPSTDAWQRRRPFFPNDKTELELVPGHYKSLFRIPH